MKNLALAVAGILTVGIGSSAQAGSINLFEFGLNIDGTTYCPSGCDVNAADLSGVAGVIDSGFDYDSGLGSISVSFSGAGAHSLVSFFDHDIDETINGYFNETGAAFGTASAGQSWEIDEPGFIGGNIYGHFATNTLDNNVFDSVVMQPDDVSMAIGWDFTLLDGQSALIALTLTEVAPTSGFYLVHSDPNTDVDLYFSSSLSIFDPSDVPEPGIVALFGMGLLAFARSRRRAV